jgi:hypothetical protein
MTHVTHYSNIRVRTRGFKILGKCRSPALRASSASQVATDLVAATNYSWLKPFVCGLASSGASGPSTAAMGNPLV